MSVDLTASRTVTWTSTAAADAVLTVVDPVGATAAPSVTRVEKTHTATITSLQPGQYQLRWTIDAQREAFADVLNVRPENPRYLLSLADARKAATGSATAAVDDDLIQLINASSTIVIEDVAGAILPKPTVQETDGGRPAINLWRKLPDGADVTVKVAGRTLVEEVDFIVDRHAMIVYAGSRTAPGYFPPGRLNVRIEYTAGLAVVPPNIEQAAIELIRHQYQVGHQAVHAEWSTDASGDDTLDTTPSGYLIPRRVLQLCRPTPKLPSF